MYSSIIIPTYNKALWLDLVLYSLKECIGIQNCEILIIDDGSSDNTRLVVEAHASNLNIRYFYQMNSGAGGARNIGIANARGELLIFLDDDRIVNRSLIAEHIQMHSYGYCNNIIFGSRQQLYLSNLEVKKGWVLEQIKKGELRNSKLLRLDDYEQITDLLFDSNGTTRSKIAWISCVFANTSIRKQILIETGMFDEAFTGWGCEDLELGYRLLRNNVGFILNKKLETYHLEHPRNSSIPEEYRRNFEYMKQKHEDIAIDLYWAFADGMLSLEDYEEIVENTVASRERNQKHFYKHLNIFRQRGMCAKNVRRS